MGMAITRTLFIYLDHFQLSVNGCHIRTLRLEGFPMSPELCELQCTPNHVVLSFKAMWATGCHFRCNPETVDSHVTFDSGIASVTEDASKLDVGILKEILLITYGKLNCVVMRGDWIKSTDQRRAAIRKDRLRFWSVLYNARDRGANVNPFVFPGAVSQVYFIEDGLDSNWKIVVRHDPRSRRVTQEKESFDFESAGTTYPLPTIDSPDDEATITKESHVPTEDVMVDADVVRTLVEQCGTSEDDTFLDDADYEDKFELQYVE